MDNIGKKIKDLNIEIENQDLKNASNEELMGYLFLVEKMKKKIVALIGNEK